MPPTVAKPHASAAEARVVEEQSLALVEMTLGALATVAGLSVLQLRMLLIVDRHHPLNLSRLATLLDLSVPSASRLVDRMVDAALVQREQAEHSRREITLSLAPKGRGALSRLRRNRARAIEKVLGSLTADERAALVTGLTAFAEAAG